MVAPARGAEVAFVDSAGDANTPGASTDHAGAGRKPLHVLTINLRKKGMFMFLFTALTGRPSR